jgi:hypothetical protein
MRQICARHIGVYLATPSRAIQPRLSHDERLPMLPCGGKNRNVGPNCCESISSPADGDGA